MALKIVWTETAKETYIYIVDYLEELWGEEHVNNFIKKTEKVFKLIALNPNRFPNIYEDDSIRKRFCIKIALFYIG